MTIYDSQHSNLEQYNLRSTAPTYTLQPQKPTSGKKIKHLAILSVVVIGGYGIHDLFAHDTTSAQIITPPVVTVSAPLKRNLETQANFLGQFAAVEHVELRPQVGGTLEKIHFKDGDLVKKGAPLFTIDPTPYEIKYSQATAQLESARAKLQLANEELTRAKILKKMDAGSTQNVEQRFSDQQAASASVNEAKAMVRDAKFDLDHASIKAPFSGKIGTHQVSIGNLIAGNRAGTGPTTLLTTIVSLDPIYLNFDMSEADYQAFQRRRMTEKGELASTVYVDLGDAKMNRTGTLDFVDNTIDRSSGTIRARATIPNKDLLLTPGGFARVRLVLTSAEPTLLVPDAAVMPDQSNHIVLTVDQDGTVKPKRVEIGDLHDGMRVIKSGIDASDLVIIEGMPSTAPGVKVKPMNAKTESVNQKNKG
jgi:multidrug efflux system membrane fusion protein